MPGLVPGRSTRSPKSTESTPGLVGIVVLGSSRSVPLRQSLRGHRLVPDLLVLGQKPSPASSESSDGHLKGPLRDLRQNSKIPPPA